ncbi:hypothetical protein LXL04_010141 [Taraxacum kok-saghyz]
MCSDGIKESLLGVRKKQDMGFSEAMMLLMRRQLDRLLPVSSYVAKTWHLRGQEKDMALRSINFQNDEDSIKKSHINKGTAIRNQNPQSPITHLPSISPIAKIIGSRGTDEDERYCVRFESSLTNAKNIACEMDIEPIFPIKRRIIRKRQFDETNDENEIQSAQESFRIDYFLIVVDMASSSLAKRSSMSQERLNGLAMLCIEKEMMDNVDLDTVINDFASKTARASFVVSPRASNKVETALVMSNVLVGGAVGRVVSCYRPPFPLFMGGSVWLPTVAQETPEF